MTTTSTFQGMNTDGKPSSRVLNPPGGASSNIFGFDDSATPQKTPVKNNPDNVNRGNNDIFHQGNHPVESTPNVRNSNNVNRGSNDIFNQGAGVSAAQPAKSTRAPRSAYNPITGEAYEQTSTKQEQVTAQKCEEKPSSEKQEAETPGSVKQEAEAADNLKQEALPEVKKQDNGGILGSNTNKPQDHPSTRVSQPPGGRSTKLW
ncbi:hematological and neurological expressed 1 protein-like isoform X1 [Biomphalaria glabrata]|uniref:Microtubule-associated protein Jupiter n=1 Tax=Biomphalaria glabrata TaxID=6526 RepID=A0A2C9L0W8_BIOGL|nr:jupiter microtubule associated homolog 1-like isoform X1 [Biomphalaria glabrata]KAI8727443.1 hematological and neurological expressed 1 protein-like isoform X1 [Biomphalaria glabrata]KAI8799199.1 hematological and neurological expressed 1 protein isoform X1 [Biomphalaria glabrata]